MQNTLMGRGDGSQLFSVVVPVYNAGQTIARCLTSILSNTCSYEIVLVDDGSTDDSFAICQQYAAQYPEIVSACHQQNGGAASARNRGVALARGRYIVFVDADDELYSGSLDAVAESLKDCSPELLFVDGVNCHRDGTEKSHFSCGSESKLGTKVLSQAEACERYVQFSKMPATPCDKIISRDLALRVPFESGRYYEDLDWCFRLLFSARTCMYRPIRYYRYIENPRSVTHCAIDQRRVDDYLRFFELWIDKMYDGSPESKVVSRFLPYEYMIFLGTMARNRGAKYVPKEVIRTRFQELDKKGIWLGRKEKLVRIMSRLLGPHAVIRLMSYGYALGVI